MNDDLSVYLRINELKNYIYCPRISFYTLCMGMDRTTRLAELGIEAEAEVKRRMKRRKHALHAVVDGERLFDVQVWSHEYRLVGQLDEIIRTPAGVHLVDYKDTSKDYGYWHLQMQAYMLCVAETLDEPILGCHIYLIPEIAYRTLKLTRRHMNQLLPILDALAGMAEMEVCPPPTSQRGKCRTCQYARFCNDVR